MNPKLYHVPYTTERIDVIVPDSVSEDIVRVGTSSLPRRRCFYGFEDAGE